MLKGLGRLDNLHLGVSPSSAREFVDPRTAASVAGLLAICACFTLGAIGAFPLWDDGWIWLLLREKGRWAIQTSFSDRPLNAWLWTTLAVREDLLWNTALGAQAVLWPAMGWVSARLWNRLFPDLKRYAWLVACVSVAPFVTKIQMVTLNIALASLLPVILAYAALLLAWRFVESNDRRSRVSLTAAALLLALAVLYQEYALPVVIVGCVLLAQEWWRAAEAPARRRVLITLAVMVLTAAVAYSLYLGWANPKARSDVRPEHVLKLNRPLAWYAQILLASLWRGLIGGFLNQLGDLPAVLASHPWTLLLGLAVAVLMTYGCYSRADPRAAADRGTWLVLLVALAAGLMPAVAFGRTPWNPEVGLDSRYGIPVLPVVAALVVRGTLAVTPRRWRWLSVCIISFVAGAGSGVEVATAVKERRLVGRLGTALQEHVVGTRGYTIAVVPLPARSLGPPMQWELVPRLGADWPPELTEKLWAYRYGGGPPLAGHREEAVKVLGPRERCLHKPTRSIRKNIRQVKRRGSVEQVLWVAAGPDDSLIIEPYCKGRR